MKYMRTLTSRSRFPPAWPGTWERICRGLVWPRFTLGFLYFLCVNIKMQLQSIDDLDLVLAPQDLYLEFRMFLQCFEWQINRPVCTHSLENLFTCLDCGTLNPFGCVVGSVPKFSAKRLECMHDYLARCFRSFGGDLDGERDVDLDAGLRRCLSLDRDLDYDSDDTI